MVAAMILVIMAVILMTRAQPPASPAVSPQGGRRRVFGGATTHLPLSVNSAGVIPIIFAAVDHCSCLAVAQFVPVHGNGCRTCVGRTAPAVGGYSTIYAIIIVFFAYFLHRDRLQSNEIAITCGRMAVHPGIRPGKNTADYIEKS